MVSRYPENLIIDFEMFEERVLVGALVVSGYFTTLSTMADKSAQDPCHPNPCGNFSVCHAKETIVACSCQPGTLGSPPHCRQCSDNTQCAVNTVCQG